MDVKMRCVKLKRKPCTITQVLWFIFNCFCIRLSWKLKKQGKPFKVRGDILFFICPSGCAKNLDHLQCLINHQTFPINPANPLGPPRPDQWPGQINTSLGLSWKHIIMTTSSRGPFLANWIINVKELSYILGDSSFEMLIGWVEGWCLVPVWEVRGLGRVVVL